MAGYSPWGHKKLDTTEHAHMHTECSTYRSEMHIWNLIVQGFYIATEPKTRETVISHQAYFSNISLALNTIQTHTQALYEFPVKDADVWTLLVSAVYC